MNLTISVFTTYGLLILSVFCLWAPKQTQAWEKGARPWWPYPFAAAFCAGLIFGFINLAAIAVVIILAAAAMAFGGYWGKWPKRLGAVVLISFGIALLTHILPGFSNHKYIDQMILSEDAAPFTSYLNFDKTMLGLFLLAFCHDRANSAQQWRNIALKLPLNLLTVFMVLIPVSFFLGYVSFQPKLVSILPVWAVVNLSTSCMAEEAFFRGFIQKSLKDAWGSSRFGAFAALLTASIAFGLIHYRGGVYYVVLSTLAGLAYGWAYERTGRIESSILTHFLLNLTHILLFTYPAAAR